MKKTLTPLLLFFFFSTFLVGPINGQELMAEQVSGDDKTEILVTEEASEEVTETTEAEAPQETQKNQEHQVELKADIPLDTSLASDFTSDYKLEEHYNKWIIQYRYLGVLSQVGIERSLGGQVSAGLYYGRYAGKVAGTDKLGFIPGLEHAALQVNAYLNSEKMALANGLVTRFAVHVNKQKENDLVKSIQVDGVDVIVPGQTKVGTLLGIGYQWSWKKVSLNAGVEYLTMGALKSFVPLAIGVGVTF